MILSQAPGAKVHESGVLWNDASGKRLLDWLKIDETVFYDETLIAMVPMGFCYPGANPKGGDNPPRPECAPLWHPLLREALGHVELTLLVGQYAQRPYLAGRMKNHDGDGQGVPGISTGTSADAASELADRPLANQESLVRNRCFAGVAPPPSRVDRRRAASGVSA